MESESSVNEESDTSAVEILSTKACVTTENFSRKLTQIETDKKNNKTVMAPDPGFSDLCSSA